jgi:hypothetical protein
MLAADPAVTVTLALPDTLPEVATTVPVPDTVPVNNPLALMLPIPPVTDQVGDTANVLLKLSLPSALNCLVVPDATVVGLGVTDMLTRAPTLTVTPAVACKPDPLLTVRVVAPVATPLTVTTLPLTETEAIDVLAEVALIVSSVPSDFLAVTEIVSEEPFMMFSEVLSNDKVGVGVGVGLTVGVGVGVGVDTTTVIVALPDLVVSLLEVAVIAALPAASPVTSPLDDTVAISSSEEDQLTSLSVEPLPYVTVAVTGNVPPTFIVADVGVTSTDSTVGVS